MNFPHCKFYISFQFVPVISCGRTVNELQVAEIMHTLRKELENFLQSLRKMDYNLVMKFTLTCW